MLAAEALARIETKLPERKQVGLSPPNPPYPLRRTSAKVLDGVGPRSQHSVHNLVSRVTSCPGTRRVGKAGYVMGGSCAN